MVSVWVRRGLGGLCVGTAVCLFSPDAAASSHTPFRLEYKAPAGCAGEQAVRDGVTARLGLDPFIETEPRTISVEVTRRKPSGFHAKITIIDGENTRIRELDSVDSRCSEIEADLAFVLRMIVEPVLIKLPSESGSPESPSPPTPSEEPKEQAAPKPAESPNVAKEVPPPPEVAPHPPPKPVPASKPVTFELSAGVLAAAFVTPGPIAIGGMLGGSLRWRSLLVGFELNGLADVPGATEQVPVNMSLWTGSTIFCYAPAKWSACGLARLGGRRVAPADGTSVAVGTGLIFAPGVRVAYDVPVLEQRLSVRVQADVDFPTGREVAFTDRGTLWSSPIVFGTVAVALIKPF